MEIQNIIEKILKKHNIDASKDFYLKLTMPPYIDLVLERNGDIVLVGYYIEQNGDLISDPVLAMFVLGKQWYPLRIEQILGDITCAYYGKGKYYIHQNRVKGFLSFQRMFAKNIREQCWLENGVKVQTGLVCEVMFIGKDAPNPMKDLSCYAKPNDYQEGK